MSPRTRYLVAGIGGLALAVVLGLAIAAVLRGVTTPPVAESTTPPATPSASAPAEAAPPPAPPVVERPQAGANECVDALGDGAADLDSVQLNADDDDLAVQFRLAAPLDEASLGVSVTADDGKSYLLAAEVRDGKVERVTVQDFDRSRTDEVRRPSAVVDGATVTVVFPDALKRLGDDWAWSAFASTDGSARDSCATTPFVG